MLTNRMLLKDVSHCAASLDFSPSNMDSKPIPTLTSVAVNGVVIFKSLNSNQCLFLETSPEKGAELFADFYPGLTLVDLAHLQVQLVNHPGLLDWERLLSKYHLSPSTNLEQTLRILHECPKEFKDWASEKKMSVQDLAPLRLLPSVTEASPLLVKTTQAGLSKSEGCRALELSIELLLQSENLDSLLQIPKENWLAELYSRRYRKTLTQDHDKESRLKALPWPRNSQVKFVRRGDRAGLELKIFFGSQQDLKVALSALNHIAEKSDVWTLK